MKTKIRFFKELEHNRPVYYALVPDPYDKNNCHVTDGNTLTDAVYMGCDLTACLFLFPDTIISASEMSFQEVINEAKDIGLTNYIGTLDENINVHYHSVPNRQGQEPLNIIMGYYYISKGYFPNTKIPMRYHTLRKAYHMLDFSSELYREDRK